MKTYSYGKQNISWADCWAVFKTLRSNYLTCGSQIKRFEQAVCDYTGAKYCVAVSSGTAALHLAMLVLNLKPEDEVITTPITFLASANCIMFVGAKPVFADIEPDTANIDVNQISQAITNHTKALIPVHFAGQSCDMEAISKLARQQNLFVVEDAAHAIGADYKGQKIGCCQYSDMTTFSFHPVKNITTAEGGAITTNNEEFYYKLLALRAHGSYKDGDLVSDWRYEMRDLGFNYRLTDLQAALGCSQLKRLEKFKQRRREIVEYYNENLACKHLIERDYSDACFHLYPILLDNRDQFYHRAKEYGLNLQVHYIPVHTQPYYLNLGYRYGDFPQAENYYKKTISLPLYPSLTDKDLRYIIFCTNKILEEQ